MDVSKGPTTVCTFLTVKGPELSIGYSPDATPTDEWMDVDYQTPYYNKTIV